MLKRISFAAFWLAFFGFFLYKLIPKFTYISNDTWKHWGNDTALDNSIFALHIFAGVIVYCGAILQFTPAIRNKYIAFHRTTGRLYILSSLFCIVTLYAMIPRGGCVACRPSQFTVTSLWLLFTLLAFYFIKQRKIVLHKRMMINSFICAAYFVTIRVIDTFAMNVFYFLLPDEATAFLVSDMFVWLVPLLGFNIYWLIKDKYTLSLRTVR